MAPKETEMTTNSHHKSDYQSSYMILCEITSNHHNENRPSYFKTCKWGKNWICE